MLITIEGNFFIIKSFKKIFRKLAIKSQLFILTSEPFASYMFPFLCTCSFHCSAYSGLPCSHGVHCSVLCSRGLCAFILSRSFLRPPSNVPKSYSFFKTFKIAFWSLPRLLKAKRILSFEFLTCHFCTPAIGYTLKLYMYLLFMLLFFTNS